MRSAQEVDIGGGSEESPHEHFDRLRANGGLQKCRAQQQRGRGLSSCPAQCLKPFAKFGALAGMEFQKAIEQKAWHLAGNTQKVPAQRMVDFTQSKVSNSIPKTSYVPGTTSVEMGQVFPGFLSQILREGFSEFGKSMKGYLTNEAILHAPESRTSSPVRIPRDEITLEHLQIKGLYPCGEGAGYAGGIISAAIDGEKCALKIGECLLQ